MKQLPTLIQFMQCWRFLVTSSHRTPFLTSTAYLYWPSEIFCSLESIWASFCWRSANSPRPEKSTLNRAMMESIIWGWGGGRKYFYFHHKSLFTWVLNKKKEKVFGEGGWLTWFARWNCSYMNAFNSVGDPGTLVTISEHCRGQFLLFLFTTHIADF